jgi:hypothetical protein
MTQPVMITAIVRRLEEAGYVRLSSPLRFASVDFNFTAALRGSGARAFDLVIVINAATGGHGDTDPENVRNRVETLSRALDITASRLTLTVLLVGASLGSSMKLLAETCRVLQVPAFSPDGDGGIPPSQLEALEDHIRVLLPLKLPNDEREDQTGINGALDRLAAQLPEKTDAVLIHEVVLASLRGDGGVQSALGTRIDDVLGKLDSEKMENGI